MLSTPLPVRGPKARRLGLPLPPARMPMFQGGRPLKRWRYVGMYTPELVLCVGEARVAGMPQRFWAVALPDGRLVDRTVTGVRGGVRIGIGHARVEHPGVRIDVAFVEADDSNRVDVVSPHGDQWIWTAKQVRSATATVEVGPDRWTLTGDVLVDDSAGYHARRTTWRWSAGAGTSAAGERVAWNLVAGVHDDPADGENTIWIDGEPRPVGRAVFAGDLSSVTVDGSTITCSEWSAREDHSNLGLVRSDYRQPFGAFSGALPGGIELRSARGVMEWHDARW